MRYAVYGIGGCGREVAPFIQEQISAGSHIVQNPVVFVDDSASLPSMVNDIPVISFEQLISRDHCDRHVVVTVGDGKIRKKIEDRCREHGLVIGSVVARTARNLGYNQIGEGAVLCDFSAIMVNVKIGKSFQCNIYSSVAHDCVIGDYVTFAPSVTCNGNIHIHDFAYIGTGAVFKQGKPGAPLIVGEGAIVGMGAVVTKSIDPYTVVAGNPAKLLRKIAIK